MRRRFRDREHAGPGLPVGTGAASGGLRAGLTRHRFGRSAPLGAALVGLCLLLSGGAAADNSCRFALNGACDEGRYGGPGVCDAGTDDADCNAHIAGNNTCQWAYDGECDDPGIGTGACTRGTDESDCRALLAGSDDSCHWANDGECDEVSIGTGACIDGTDASDCQPVAFMRHRSNACDFSFDDQCDEPSGGTGRCEPRSDTADCLGRARPYGISDHFFGFDERFRPNFLEQPWRAIGLLDGTAGSCTAALVAANVAVTAAHCVLDDYGRLVPGGRFRAGYDDGTDIAVANIVSTVANPLYDPNAPDEAPRGQDWAFLELDQPIGETVGMFGVFQWTEEEIAAAPGPDWYEVFQAGYSWDSPEHLTGNAGCPISEMRPDNSLLHQCDTTQGDSGSPIFVQTENGYEIIALDSEFFSADKGGPLNLAVDSRAFLEPLMRFIEKVNAGE